MPSFVLCYFRDNKPTYEFANGAPEMQKRVFQLMKELQVTMDEILVFNCEDEKNEEEKTGKLYKMFVESNNEQDDYIKTEKLFPAFARANFSMKEESEEIFHILFSFEMEEAVRLIQRYNLLHKSTLTPFFEPLES